jgi:DNA-binding transcriptional LysR family regulator
MELRQLEAFVAVAEERNFTRAATRLFVTQSGLSATIRSLEKDLRAPLFVRSTRRVDLTPAGAALLPEARRTLASARAAADAVTAVEGLERGTLTLGVMQSISLSGLPNLLARYREAYPGISLTLQHASTTELLRLLHEGAADITFATALDEIDSDVLSLPLFSSPLVVCANDAGLGRQATVALRALAARDHVGFPAGWGVRILADHAMRSAGLEPRVDLEVNDTNTLLDLIEAGLGVAIIPDAIARLRPHLHTLTIRDGSWNWTIGAQTLAPMPANPAARALWDMLRSGGRAGLNPGIKAKDKAPELHGTGRTRHRPTPAG